MEFIIGSIALLAGLGIGYIIRHQIALNKVNSAEAKAKTILSEAKLEEQNLALRAKEKAIKIIEEAKSEERSRRKDIQEAQRRMEKRESLFDQKILDLQDKQQKLQEKAQRIDQVKQEIKALRDQEVQKLEEIAQLSQNEAKEQLLKAIEEKAQEDVASRIRKVKQLGTEEMEQHAKQIVVDAMHRYTHSVVSETTTTNVQLPSDEMKGRIIGKEGRNIKAIENLTGVEVLIDDTPEMLTISGFSPIRRHIARIAIEKLMKDGRIHPGRVEETVQIAKQELSADIRKAGEEACYQMGITGLDPKIVQILGRLKYRTSFGQNALVHSLEVGHLSVFLAERVGADLKVARVGGLLHDIGKAVDHEVQGAHPQLGYDIMKKFGLPEEIAYMSIAHHEDEPKTIEGIIVKVADMLSASRPGARKDTVEKYIQRITELEGVANSFDGVQKAYAIQAGREIRVFAHPDQVNDAQAFKLAQDMARRIEDQMNYPGEVKITLIREKRFTEYAR